MAATECTVRLRPVPSTASQAAILEELQARGLLAYLGSLGLRGASDPFEDPSNTTVFVADLYFGAAGQAKAAAPFLGSFAFLGGTTTASLLKGTNGLSNLHQLLLPTGASPTSTPPRTPPSSNGLPGHLKPPSAGTVQIDKKATCAPVPIPPKSDETAARNGVVSSPANGQLNFSNGSWAHDQVGLQSLRGEKRGLPEKEAPQGEPQNRETRAVSPLSSGQGVAKVSLGQGLQGSSDATQQPSQEEIREGASENASASAASSATVTKYTADQTVAVEPVPAGVSMEALLEELKRALADIDSRNRSDLARGLQNCSQALTDPRGDAPFAYLNFRDAVDAREAAVLLSRAVLFNQRVRAVVKSNFVGQVSGQCYVGHGRGLRQVDEAGYKQAGILLYRKTATGVEAAYATTATGLALPCGPRKPGETATSTAARMSLEMTRVQVDLKGLLQRADRGVQFAWEAVQTPQGVVGLVLYLVDADTPGAVTSSSVGAGSPLQSLSWQPLRNLATRGSVPVSWPSVVAPVSTTLQQWAAQVIADHAAVLEFRKRVLAAKTEAETEKPKLLQAITQLRQPVPKPPARLPTDLVPLQPGDREYAEFTKQWASIPAVKIRQVKRVNNPEQAQRFDRYAASLGQGDPSQQLKLLHGTHPVANANSIARKGPDINRAGSANGTRFGQGFYTAETPDEVVKYATDQGAVCVCTAAPGVMKYNGDTSVTAGTLAAEGFHSVVRGDWHVLFHPDSLRVDYVVDFGPDDTIDARKAKAEQDAREQHALAVEVRAQEVRAKENRVAMGAYFVERCDAAAAGVEGLSGEKFGMRRKVFQLEAQQYGQGLPIYAFKKQFLESLQRANGLVLEGGTGVGKSVMVPQWVYDDLFVATGFGHRKVAVLVPRRAIAENLAAYISQLRGSEIGEEVGLGIDGDVRMSGDSRLIFMTYGFFRAISTHDPNFSQWGAVVLDEAHEGKTDAASIFVRLGAACRARPEFLAIVMSATIDVEVYRAALVAGGMPRAPPTLKVEGVTYPVKQVWWDGEPWRPSQENAFTDLALETVRILNKEPSGNVLVFLSTTSAVLKTVEELRKSLAHQPGILVYPLFAAMSSEEKHKVISFGNLTKFPNHATKRLVCCSTNIAEAGITIADVSTVVETGWELEMVFDHVTKRTTAREVRISRASHAQRRGRAGRTRPGTCYSLYSAADFAAFPEYGTPEILRSNLENFALGMLAAGLDPLALALVEGDRARERLQASVERLKVFKAVSAGSNGKPSITELGRKLARLPLDLNLAMCVLAAADARLSCSNEVAIVACVSQMAAMNLFERGSKVGKERFTAPSGDHETYLAVFEAWVQAGRQDAWCAKNGLHAPALLAADSLLTKLQAGMKAAKVPALSPAPGTNRIQAVLRAMCAGYATQTAVPFSTDAVKAGYLLTSDYVTSPTLVLQHPACSVQGPGGPLLLFQSRTVTADGREMLLGMSRVEQAWVEAALAFDPGSQREFTRTMQLIARKRYDVPVPLATSKQVTAFINNLADLRKAFPAVLFTFHSAKPSSNLAVHAPIAAWPLVEARVNALIDNLGLETRSISLAHVSPPGDVLLKHLKDDVTENLDTTCELKLGGGELRVTTFKLVIEAAVAAARRRLGIATPLPTPRGALGDPERERLRAVQAGSADGIAQMFGKGKLGSMLLLARLILEKSALWIYGGFIRDVIVRGDAHADLDLDVGVPAGSSAQAGMDEVARLAAAAGLRFSRTKQATGPKVVAYYFDTLDGAQQFEVQVVDAHAFMQKDPRIDFDVNNLKIASDGKLAVKYDLPNRDVDMILGNIRSHTLVVLKPALEVYDRIDKMRKRGWTITFPNARA